MKMTAGSEAAKRTIDKKRSVILTFPPHARGDHVVPFVVLRGPRERSVPAGDCAQCSKIR